MNSKPPRFDAAATRLRLQPRDSTASLGPMLHITRTNDGPRAATDHLLLSPEEIILEGPYVRKHVDQGELDALRDAILAGGEIKQAIGVRMEGAPLEPRYVLVYGMRRWLASRSAGLERIPVRNHGRITVGESLALQVAENEARVDPHAVDTAVSYQLLVEQGGMTQAAIARVAGRSAAHISYMRAVGEAVLQLTPEERDSLYFCPEATVPRFQKIAPLKTLEERVQALRSLIGDGSLPAGEGRDRATTAYRAGPRKGTDVWTLRVSYSESELRNDPELASRLERFLAEQLERIREQLHGSGRGGKRHPTTWEIDPK